MLWRRHKIGSKHLIIITEKSEEQNVLQNNMLKKKSYIHPFNLSLNLVYVYNI